MFPLSIFHLSSVLGVPQKNTLLSTIREIYINEVSDIATAETSYNGSVEQDLFGRLTIYSNFGDITAENVVSEVNKALSYHIRNLLAEEYLYWYRRGVQPILQRTKERNSFICNKVTENHADEICAFKNGYFLTQPAVYVSRKKGVKSKVDKLNEFLYRSGKHQADNELVDWFHTVGLGVLFVKPNDCDEKPFEAYALDPRTAFVVYSMSAGNKPVMGVHLVADDETLWIDVFTKDKYFKLIGASRGKLIQPQPTFIATATAVVEERPNLLGEIPFIEYRYNSVNMGAFEGVINLLDCINLVESNRADGVEQFIQNLVVLYNCQLPEDEDANSLKEKGLLVLKSVGENKASIDILSQELDQAQTQSFVDNLYAQVLRICSMPSSTKGGSSTSDTGAAVLARDGWYQANAAARNTEDLFKKSNAYFDKIILKILKQKNLLDIAVSDFELHFVRNETDNAQSKAQTLFTMLSAGVAPELAFAKSGISNDPVSDVKQSQWYLEQKWGSPNAPKPQEGIAINPQGAMVETDKQDQADEPQDNEGGEDNAK